MRILTGMSVFTVNISTITDTLMSRKLTIPSEKVSTVNVRLGSKLLNLTKTAEISEGWIKTRVSSTSGVASPTI